MKILAKRAARVIKRCAFRALNLKIKMESGLVFPVTSLDNWNLINEIFINGEYAVPIGHVLDQARGRGRLSFVDLGANNGMFSLYLMNRFKNEVGNGVLSGLLVEPAAACVAEIRTKVLSQMPPSYDLRVAKGLVGQRSGSAALQLHAESLRNHLGHSNTSTFGTTIGSELVPFIELDREAAWLGEIDLLKCDIEGSEFSLVDNYAGFLGRIRNIVIEVHDDFGDIVALKRQIASLGFDLFRPVKDRPKTPIWWFGRSA